VTCRLSPSGIAEIDRWLALLRDALAKNYDRLDQVLAAEQRDAGREAP